MIPGTRLTSKIHGHDKLSTRIPPNVGPTDGPTIVPSAKIDWLNPSCSGGNVSRRITCAVASRPPPNAPCTTRKRIKAQADVDMPQGTDARVNPAIDARK